MSSCRCSSERKKNISNQVHISRVKVKFRCSLVLLWTWVDQSRNTHCTTLAQYTRGGTHDPETQSARLAPSPHRMTLWPMSPQHKAPLGLPQGGLMSCLRREVLGSPQRVPQHFHQAPSFSSQENQEKGKPTGPEMHFLCLLIFVTDGES